VIDLKHRVVNWLRARLSSPPPIITETSQLKTIAAHYPQTWELLCDKYHLKWEQMGDEDTLSSLCKKFDLPPAQIIFMEIQLYHLNHQIEHISAAEAHQLMRQNSSLLILDVREAWERQYGSLPQAQTLDMTLLKTLKDHWPKEQRILIYCHFGVRSLDCASYLVQEGFTQVSVIQGGIDAWSIQVDPTLPRYSGAYC